MASKDVKKPNTRKNRSIITVAKLVSVLLTIILTSEVSDGAKNCTVGQLERRLWETMEAPEECDVETNAWIRNTMYRDFTEFSNDPPSEDYEVDVTSRLVPSALSELGEHSQREFTRTEAGNKHMSTSYTMPIYRRKFFLPIIASEVTDRELSYEQDMRVLKPFVYHITKINEKTKTIKDAAILFNIENEAWKDLVDITAVKSDEILMQNVGNEVRDRNIGAWLNLAQLTSSILLLSNHERSLSNNWRIRFPIAFYLYRKKDRQGIYRDMGKNLMIIPSYYFNGEGAK